MTQALKWAVVAACLLFAGFTAGRLRQGGADQAELRASIEAAVRKQLRAELSPMVREEVRLASASTLDVAGQQAERLVGSYLSTLQLQRVEDRRLIQSSFERIESQRVADLASLKKELDTLAVNTDAGLRHTAAGLVELATYRASPQISETIEKRTQ